MWIWKKGIQYVSRKTWTEESIGEHLYMWNDREWRVTIQLAWDRVQYMYKIVNCRYQILLSVADFR